MLCIRATDNASTTTQLIHRGVLFYRHYARGDTFYWRCNRSNAPQRCRARLATRPNSSVIEIQSHNHDIGLGIVGIGDDDATAGDFGVERIDDDDDVDDDDDCVDNRIVDK